MPLISEHEIFDSAQLRRMLIFAAHSDSDIVAATFSPLLLFSAKRHEVNREKADSRHATSTPSNRRT